jgi:recombination protein RecR
MEYYPPSLIRLIKALSGLPGIGEKTAARLALHILRSSYENAKALSQSILDVKEKVRLCSKCFGLADTDPCWLCASPHRNPKLICIVEQPSDLVALEKSKAFVGLYHVLHGSLSPMNGVGPDDLKIKELMARVADNEVEEVIIATNTNVEGEATASYLTQCLKPYPVRLTRIASGIPVGGDLKYMDEVTIKRAMEKREGI